MYTNNVYEIYVLVKIMDILVPCLKVNNRMYCALVAEITKVGSDNLK